MDVKGLRISLIICGFLLALGCRIRCITMDPATMTWLSNCGAHLIGFGGSVPYAAPAKLSAVWFPPDQRTTATSIASFSNDFGVAMAFIIGDISLHSQWFSLIVGDLYSRQCKAFIIVYLQMGHCQTLKRKYSKS
ncbi:solute carrier family 49 member 4 homolog isoform X1 [Dreissena polymorpha]|uniref:solute carrier family 49 member 4 homolog isoform X1 n=1 Tax=Dreissena polymorpha TaxID=45954 RepID=UPI0022654EB0|nr:solute carrier family 49 member 4 homolog isoform X1 [Dreissena polymorpha]